MLKRAKTQNKKKIQKTQMMNSFTIIITDSSQPVIMIFFK